jgi:RND family efflux transporter MFP subunit
MTFFLAGCGRPDSAGGSGAPKGPGPGEPQPLAVEALRVTRGQFVTAIKTSGTIAGIREALVISETQGIVERLDFELGEEVDAGQFLLEVDDEIAALNMQQAEEQLENARIDYQTTENLVEKGGATRADLLHTRSALRGAEARYKQARKVFLDCAIKTPIPGYIASKEAAASLGNYLSPGMTIARVTDLSRIRLELSVGEGLVGLIE